MGIVTRCTRLGANRIPTVRFLEGFLLAVVTGQAESRVRGPQQVRLGGTVGNMAYLASAGLKRFVHHFLFEQLLRMALIAKVAPFRLEQVVGLGCMRVVAERALPVFQHAVDMGLGQPELLFAVAGVTNLIADILENELGDDAVTKVAAFAFLFLCHRMDVLHRKIFFLEFGMAVKAFLLRERLFFDRGAA